MWGLSKLDQYGPRNSKKFFKKKETKNYFVTSFPTAFTNEVNQVCKAINIKSRHSVPSTFPVTFDDETVYIPERIYGDAKQLEEIAHLTKLQQEIIYCLFSRHADGFVREKCLRKIAASNNAFTVPFVLRLLGEYVLEIIDYIYEHRSHLNKEIYSQFIFENSQFYEITCQRIYSYWDCYHRLDYPKRSAHTENGRTVEDYPGVKMKQYIESQILN